MRKRTYGQLAVLNVKEEIEWSAILEQGRILSSSGLQLNLEQAQMQPIAESISMLKHTQSDTHSALTFQVVPNNV